MKGKLVWSVFWALVGVFVIVIVVSGFAIAGFVPALRGHLAGWFLIISGAAFFSLGVALIVLTVKEKVGGALKKFLILTGASSAGLLPSFLLHNVVSGLFNREESVFLIIVTIVCPIGFLVGAVGTIMLTIKSKQTKQSSQNS